LKILVHPHDYLHRTKRASRNHADRLHIANRYTLQVHGLAGANALSIVKVCDESNFSGEKAACPADQEDKQGQGHRTDNYGYSDL
jgi:hypothetical protein